MSSDNRLDDLRRISDAALAVFRAAGAEQVAPDVLQPADPFLDRLGEDIRSRTYVFTDPGGSELCLRPDLTLPVARIYLKRNPDGLAARRYAYSGPAFRYQSGAALQASADHPREFEQVGIECFRDEDHQAAEARLAGLTARALRAAGVGEFKLLMGDPGLFRALLARIDMPARWRRRLQHQFWRPDAFHALLKTLSVNGSSPRGETAGDDFLSALAGLDQARVEQMVGQRLERDQIPLFGGRRIEQIAERLLEQAADRAADPLPGGIAGLIESYLQIGGEPYACLDMIRTLSGDAGLDLDRPLAVYSRRLDFLQAEGFDMDKARFDAEFGRQFEYYTGFVFQMEAMGGAIDGPLAGGGRYDGLLEDLGAPHPVPAVGAALHSDRIAAAIEAGAS